MICCIQSFGLTILSRADTEAGGEAALLLTAAQGSKPVHWAGDLSGWVTSDRRNVLSGCPQQGYQSDVDRAERGCEPAGVWNTPRWRVAKTKQKKKRVGTVQNRQIPTCCNSSSKTVSQPSPASLYHFAHILVLLLPINTRHASICLYRSAVNFNSTSKQGQQAQLHSAVQYLMYGPDIRVVLSVLKKGTFLKLVSLGRPSQKLSRFHSKQY